LATVSVLHFSGANSAQLKKANPPKGGGAKPPIYGRPKIAGLPVMQRCACSRPIARAVVIVFAAAILTACSGGGGDPTAATGSTSTGTTQPPPTPPPSPQPPPPSPGTGSATLSWLPPSSYTDGSPLTIQGYRFYAGPNQANLALVEDLPQPGLSSHMLNGLGPGQWFFAVTVYDAQGVESSFSGIASKTIN